MDPKFSKNLENCIVWIPENLDASRSPVFTFRDQEWYFKVWRRRSGDGYCNLEIYMDTNGFEKHNISFKLNVKVDKVFRDGHVEHICSKTLATFGEFTLIYDLKYKPVSQPFQTLRLTFVFPEEVSTLSSFSSKNGECWKQGHKGIDNLIEDMKGLLTDSSLCDVELKCEDGRSIEAHNLILIARSKVFAAMLKSDMEESRSGIVKIPDMDAESLKAFLSYIYTGTLPDLTVDEAKQLYEASDKYAVLGLKEICAKFLTDNFSTDNVCDLLVTADLHSDENLKEKAIAYIREKKIPCKTDYWAIFIKSHPCLAAEALTRFYVMQNP